MSKNLGVLIDEVLFYEWDPIGVKDLGGISTMRNEYSSYVKEISRIMKTKSEDAIYSCLLEIETNYMELSNTIWQKRSRKKTAKILYNLQREEDDDE